MSNKKKDRTQYDLQAWEMLEQNPELVFMVTSPKGYLIIIEPCKNVSFTAYKENYGYIFNIVSFDRWLEGFNKHHDLKCENMLDVINFYKKGGALHW